MKLCADRLRSACRVSASACVFSLRPAPAAPLRSASLYLRICCCRAFEPKRPGIRRGCGCGCRRQRASCSDSPASVSLLPPASLCTSPESGSRGPSTALEVAHWPAALYVTFSLPLPVRPPVQSVFVFGQPVVQTQTSQVLRFGRPLAESSRSRVRPALESVRFAASNPNLPKSSAGHESHLFSHAAIAPLQSRLRGD